MNVKEKIIAKKEMIKIDSCLIASKEALLQEFDQRLAEINKKIAAAQQKRTELIASYKDAPAKLREYQVHKILMIKELDILRKGTSNIEDAKKRTKLLRERIAKLEKELSS
jgi:hypothetical protein